ncbi:MAG: M20 family metallopeptidase [Deinococcota bacterium]
MEYTNSLEQAQNLQPTLRNWRRDFHQHPELSFQEQRTSTKVASVLRELGWQVREGVGRTGVLADLCPAELPGQDVPTIAIRADMDALPITEVTGADYASTVPGVMHACGHDAHTAMLLGVANILKTYFDAAAPGTWQGRVRLLFQPSEESRDKNGISGARAMLTDGVLDGVHQVIALHVNPRLPAGTCQFCDGPAYAGADGFAIWVRAAGGHGASPHEAGDPLFMLTSLLPALYGLTGRHADPRASTVLSLGQIQAGTAGNVIPSEVFLKGSIRSFDPATRERMLAELKRAVNIIPALGGEVELNLNSPPLPPLINSAEVSAQLRAAATSLLSEDKVIYLDQPFTMGSEDFAYMTQAVPGALFELGVDLDDGVKRECHMPIFDVNEEALPVGAAVMAETARRFVMGESSQG